MNRQQDTATAAGQHTPGALGDAANGPWHEIAFEDVAVSAKALAAIKEAAREILPRYVPRTAMHRLTVADSLALLGRDIYWEEGSGKLFLCSEMGDRRICLHIPAEHWQFRVTGTTQ